MFHLLMLPVSFFLSVYLCHSMSICHSLSPQSSLGLTCLSFSQAVLCNHLSVYQDPLLFSLFFSPSLVGPWSISVKVCGSSRSPLFMCLGGMLPNRDWPPNVKGESRGRRTHMHRQTHTFVLMHDVRVSAHRLVLWSCLGRFWGGIQFAGEMSVVIEERGKKGGWKDKRRRGEGSLLQGPPWFNPLSHLLSISLHFYSGS